MEDESSFNSSNEISTGTIDSLAVYDCESDDSILVLDGVPKPKCANPVTRLINDVLLDRAKYNMSYTAATDIAKRLNSMPGAEIELPAEKGRMKREVKLKYQYDHFIVCDFCKYLFKQGEACQVCHKKTEKRKDNYFIHINITQQIKHKIEVHLEEMLACAKKERIDGVISDLHDSEIYKEVASKLNENQIILPLTVSLDGAQIHCIQIF